MTLRTINIIEDQEVIDKYFPTWASGKTTKDPPPKAKPIELQLDYSDSQPPV